MRNAYGRAALGFIATSLYSQYWATIPSIWIILGISCTTLVLIAFPLRFISHVVGAIKPFVLGSIVGTAWFASVGHSYLAWQLPIDKIQQDVTIQASVISVKHTPHADRYTLLLHRFDGQTATARVRINWYRPTMRFYAGASVVLCAKLKPAHGLQNPYGFDYWRWLVSEQIIASGYVRTCAKNRLLKPATGIKSRLIYRLETLRLPGEKWIKALMFADRQGFSDEDWLTLQKTGLTHLFALSGLHMGIVFFIFFWLSRLLVMGLVWPFSAAQSIQLQVPSICLACVFSLGFVSLCGAPITLVRAWLAVTLVAITLVTSGALRPSQTLVLVFALCLLVFPHSIYALSVYLSVGAVAIILFLLWRFELRNRSILGKLVFAVKLQLLLSVFMAVLSAASFGNVYWLSALFNLICVPLVTLVFVPLCFLGLFLLSVLVQYADIVLYPLGLSLHYLMQILGSMEPPSSSVAMPLIAWLIMTGVLVILLLPGFFMKTRILVILVVSFVMYSLPKNNAQWALHVFDVGQGSALLLEHKEASLLIDTGAAYRSGFNLAKAVIGPYFAHSNTRLPIRAVLTHNDNDHAGGRKWLYENGIVNKFIEPNVNCKQGDTFYVGSLLVRVLWPTTLSKEWSDNDNSCVLMISDGKIKILIAGDIEARAERALLASGVDLSADILIAPHHGSKTSSTANFVRRVDARFVVFTTGFLNRWAFPHDEITERYKQQGAQLFNTAHHGYVRFDMISSVDENKCISVKTSRDNLAKRWYKSLSAD